MTNTTTRKRQKKVDLNNLKRRDIDILTPGTQEVMKKYKLEKQPVYDRRFALKKKIEAAGLTLEQVLNSIDGQTEDEKEVPVEKATSRKFSQEKRASKATTESTEKRDLMVVAKQVPVILKPIEINFDNFSVKLNGVPRKIAVNPETNAVEIDL